MCVFQIDSAFLSLIQLVGDFRFNTTGRLHLHISQCYRVFTRVKHWQSAAALCVSHKGSGAMSTLYDPSKNQHADRLSQSGPRHVERFRHLCFVRHALVILPTTCLDRESDLLSDLYGKWLIIQGSQPFGRVYGDASGFRHVNPPAHHAQRWNFALHSVVPGSLPQGSGSDYRA